MIDELLSGWSATLARLYETNQGRRRPFLETVLDLDLVVSSDVNIGDLPPAFIWVPTTSRIVREKGRTRPLLRASTTEIARFNRRRGNSRQTIGLMEQVSARRDCFRLACLIAALHGLRCWERPLPDWHHHAVNEISSRLGVTGPSEIWRQHGKETLPMIAELDPPFGASPFLFGGLVALFLLRIQRRCFPARVVPITDQKSAAISLADFTKAIAPIGAGLCRPHGNQKWRGISRDELEALIWTVPRSHLAERFSISDQAIAKRCQSWGIPLPPRGFWRVVSQGKAPGKLLRKKEIQPPALTGIL